MTAERALDLAAECSHAAATYLWCHPKEAEYKLTCARQWSAYADSLRDDDDEVTAVYRPSAELLRAAGGK
jgi:hypothetical protein